MGREGKEGGRKGRRQAGRKEERRKGRNEGNKKGGTEEGREGKKKQSVFSSFAVNMIYFFFCLPDSRSAWSYGWIVWTSAQGCCLHHYNS